MPIASEIESWTLDILFEASSPRIILPADSKASDTAKCATIAAGTRVPAHLSAAPGVTFDRSLPAHVPPATAAPIPRTPGPEDSDSEPEPEPEPTAIPEPLDV